MHPVFHTEIWTSCSLTAKMSFSRWIHWSCNKPTGESTTKIPYLSPRRNICMVWMFPAEENTQARGGKRHWMIAPWMQTTFSRAVAGQDLPRSVLLLLLAGRSHFHKTVETACQSKRAAECLHVCLQLLSPESTSLTHRGGREMKEEGGICSGYGWCGSSPCKGQKRRWLERHGSSCREQRQWSYR